MIHLYSGNPGSGKTLHSAEEIYHALRCGKNVIANFSIDESLIKPVRKGKKMGVFFSCNNNQLNVNSIIGFAKNFHQFTDPKKMERQTYLVIDECQLNFNARSWNDSKRSAWNAFFTNHRRYGFEIILITQFDNSIDKQIRSLIEYEYKHFKVNNYKFLGKLLGLLCGGSLFCYTRHWYSKKAQIGITYFRGKKRYYNFYNSYKTLSQDDLWVL